MARLEHIETRLLNWARWRLTGGGGALGYSRVNMLRAFGGAGSRYAEAPIPTNAIEAGETDDAVGRLDRPLRITVEVHYLEQGVVRGRLRRLATMSARLTHLCCSKSTYYERLDAAHAQLAEHFAAREDRQRAERGRVHDLLARARP